jgi:hypothetical protein
MSDKPITTLAELRDRVKRRMEACRREAQEKELWNGRKASFETSAYEMEWVLGAISQVEHAEKNHLAALYADDALERPGQLTEEQKQRNLENLKAYTQEAQIPDGAPSRDVLRSLQICASLWEPGARIQGNLRAGDIVRACAQAIAEMEAWDKLTDPRS